MKFTWFDYNKIYANTVEDWLDTDAKQFTGCDEGWDSFYEYWKNDDEMMLGNNYWCKVVYECDAPVAVIAISMYQNIFTIMEYIVDPTKRGKGYGSTALKELLENSTTIIGKDITQAKAVIYPNNIASQKAFEKAGFTFDYAHPDGDSWYYKFDKFERSI